jgi:AraC family transcriptional regulator
MAWHRHKQSYVSLILRGGYQEETRASFEELGSGDLVIHPPGERHTDEFGPSGAICLNIEEAGICSGGFAGIAWPSLASRRPVRGAGFAVGLALGDFLTGSGSASALLSSVAAELRRRLGAATPAPSELTWIEQLDRIIENRFRERVGLAALAKLVQFTPGHVARRYRAVRGLTVGQRVRQLRAEWAAQRIAETKQPLSVIAAEAGFADQSHLTRAIRTHCGRTPTALR